jgi:hypothetical protein
MRDLVMHRPLSLLLGGALLLAPVTPAVSQDALPSGREVVDRYIDAIGGRAAIMAQNGRHMMGSFSIPSQGLGGALDVYAQPPNRMLVRVTLQGIGEIMTGYDGTTAWAMNPMLGPQVLDSVQLRQLQQQADFYSSLYPDTQIASLETLGVEAFEGVSCYNVQVTTTWGETYNEFFSVDDGLQVGSRRKQESPMGAVETVAVASDWRVVEGMKVPFKSVQRTMGIEQVITVDSVSVLAVPDSVFALPPEIEALVRK